MADWKRYRRFIILFWAFIGFGIFSFILLLCLIAWGVFGPMPSFAELENPKSALAAEVYAADGVLLGKYYFENRSEATFEEIPTVVKNALIATEDIRFYEHSGVDSHGFFTAMVATLFGDSRGGSTITQQLAKNMFKRPEHPNIFTLGVAKLKEWITAIKLERRYTKDEIIALYLNTVPFSDNSFGIKSASRTYFNKPPDSLNVSEAAVLVGMLKGSTIYNPRSHPKKSMERRNTVLAQMAKYNFISEQELDRIKDKPIELHYVSPDHNEGLATYFREQLRLELLWWCRDNKKADGSSYNLYKDGLKIYTTIDSRMQKYAEEAMSEHMKDLQKEFYGTYKNGSTPWGKDENFILGAWHQTSRYIGLKKAKVSEDSIQKVLTTKIPMTVFSWNGDRDTLFSPLDSIKYYKFFLQSGFMAMDPHTGFVKAWVGGIDHHYFKYDHVNIYAKRQVGSTFKPIVYTVAIENGWSPCFQVPNQKIVFENFQNWSPSNSDGKYGGILSLYQALAGSVNCVTAFLMKQIGPQPVIDQARKMGIESKMDPYPSLCLGVPDISVMEMVGAYSTFANKGVYTKPIYVTRIEDKYGNVIRENQPKRVEAISEEVASVMIGMLENVVNFGTAARLRIRYGMKNQIAGKTGTTQNNTDGWFIGIVPNLVAGGWVGGDDRIIRFRSIQYGQGANMSLPTWALFMKKVYADKSLGISDEDEFEKPTGEPTIETDCTQYQHRKKQENELQFGADAPDK